MGDQYIFVAMDADTKLVPTFLVGKRDLSNTINFIDDLRSRLAPGRIQLTSDGFSMYIYEVDCTFARDIDYAQLIKRGSKNSNSTPRAPVETWAKIIYGTPDKDHISTSFIERQNLTIRMCMRRLNRMTNGFSKKLYNLEMALALHFAYYNFCRVHQTLKVTPAMEAGITKNVWELDRLLFDKKNFMRRKKRGSTYILAPAVK